MFCHGLPTLQTQNLTGFTIDSRWKCPTSDMLNRMLAS